MPVAIVTGAGTGIGRATAIGLSRLGYSIALVGRREGPLRECVDHLRTPSLCLAVDITDGKSHAGVVRSTLDRFGRIDMLVNNAGLAPLQPIDRTDAGLIDEVFAVNAIAPAKLIASCWPQMLAQRSGCVINVSTLGTMDPFPGFFAYASAKAALNTMARSCAGEGTSHGIRAFAIAPGAVETGMLRGLFSERQVPRESALEPEDVAKVICDCATGVHDDHNGRTLFMTAERGIFLE